LAHCEGRNGCFESLSLFGIEQGGGDFVKPFGALLEFGEAALEKADTISEMKRREDGHADRIITGTAGGDLIHEVVDGLGQRLGLAGLPGGAERIGVLEDRDANEIFFS